MKKREVNPLAVILLVAVIVILGLFIINYIDNDSKHYEERLEDVNGQLNHVEMLESDAKTELKKLEDGKTIVNIAREYDYVLPGEIVFTVDEALLED